MSPRPINKRNSALLEMAACVGLGHAWEVIERGRRRQGTFANMPVLVIKCVRCTTEREDVLAWNGDMVTRRYQVDETYITAARMLHDEHSQRRRIYRELTASKIKTTRKVPHE